MDVKTQEFEDPLKQYYLKKLKYAKKSVYSTKYEGLDKIKPLLLVQNTIPAINYKLYC